MSETTAMNLLEDWCRGMEVDIHRSLLVIGIPEDCGQADIEETLNAILLPLGTYRVLNRIFLRHENVKAALIEVSEGVNLSSIPREFPGRGGVWRVVCRDATQDAEFLKNLNEFLDAEGRTWEDVVHLLQLNQRPALQNRSQSLQNWVGSLGMLLGAVMPIILRKDAGIRSREEARAEEATEAELMAGWVSARTKIKKEPGLCVDVSSALKMEDCNRWRRTEDHRDPLKPLVGRSGGKIRSRRRKQRKNPKQQPICWSKPKSDGPKNTTYLEDSGTSAAQSLLISESVKSNKKPFVKQEQTAWKKKRAWKVPRDLPQDARLAGERSESPEISNQDDGPKSPPKKRAVDWISNRIPSPMRKKKVGLGPVSYVLVDSEGTKKKPVIPKKGPGFRRGVVAQRAPQPAEAPASVSRAQKAKAGGFPHVSKGE
uniref:PNMA family member 8A n=1 Tax=Nannospalax galili TaxID=1026970 RepID=A0A8C6QL95_NANGA